MQEGNLKLRIVFAPMLAFGVLTTVAGAATPPKFIMMSSWFSGTDTNLGGEEVGTADEMFPGDKPLCDAILAALNKGTVPARHFDAAKQPVLPSGLTVHPWLPTVRPQISANGFKDNLEITDKRVLIDTLQSCDKPVIHKGRIAYTCQFSRIKINAGKSGSYSMVRILGKSANHPEFEIPEPYYLVDSQSNIVDQFFPRVGRPFGKGTFFTFGGVDYMGGWGEEDRDFSDGYAGKKFRQPKVTFEVAQLSVVEHEVAAFRICVFAVNSKAI